MRVKKRFRSMIAALVAVCTFMTVLSVSAAAEEVTVQPRYTAVINMQAGLDFNWLGGAKCTGRVNFENGYTGNLTATLQRSTNQVLWEDVKTWTASGSETVEISKTYYVTSGYYYCLEVTVDAYNAAGMFVETVSLCSSIVYH